MFPSSTLHFRSIVTFSIQASHEHRNFNQITRSIKPLPTNWTTTVPFLTAVCGFSVRYQSKSDPRIRETHVQWITEDVFAGVKQKHPEVAHYIFIAARIRIYKCIC
jgi:hypothetical protein